MDDVQFHQPFRVVVKRQENRLASGSGQLNRLASVSPGDEEMVKSFLLRLTVGYWN